MNESFKTDPSLATSARAANESGSYLCASNVTPTSSLHCICFSVFVVLLPNVFHTNDMFALSEKSAEKKTKPAGCRSRIISKNRPVPIFGRSTGASLWETITFGWFDCHKLRGTPGDLVTVFSIHLIWTAVRFCRRRGSNLLWKWSVIVFFFCWRTQSSYP